MRRQTLTEAIGEARRFIRLAEAAIHAEQRNLSELNEWRKKEGIKEAPETLYERMNQSKENASTLRASMDLTRKLSELRKGE